eukprot:7260096-Prymnesium_polylepis.1
MRSSAEVPAAIDCMVSGMPGGDERCVVRNCKMAAAMRGERRTMSRRSLWTNRTLNASILCPHAHTHKRKVSFES